MSGEMGKREVELLLRAHYRAERGGPDADAKAATSRPCAPRRPAAGARGGAADVVRRIRGRPGALHPPAGVGGQLALVAAMVALCLIGDSARRDLSLASGVLAAATVLVGLPELLASAAHRVAELEYVCRFDCRAVALARLIVLGCSTW